MHPKYSQVGFVDSKDPSSLHNASEPRNLNALSVVTASRHLEADGNESLEPLHENISLPYYSLLYILVVICLFVWGIYFIIGPKNVRIGTLSPVSPPIRGMFYSSVSEWPECSDRRREWWTVLSHQFIHAGFVHLISNQIMLLVFGSFFETRQGALRTLLIFQMSILSGCLGHTCVWPYRPLIGNSHGVYGLYGACGAHVIINCDAMPRKQALFLVAVFLVQVAMDIISFIYFFNPYVGYAAHLAGFLCGFLLSFGISRVMIERCWKHALGTLCLVLVAGTGFYVVYHYESTWPPQQVIYPSWSSVVPSQNCCSRALQLQETYGYTQNEITSLYYCDGWMLAPR